MPTRQMPEDFRRMREILEMLNDVAAAEEEIEQGEEMSQDDFRQALLAEGRL